MRGELVAKCTQTARLSSGERLTGEIGAQRASIGWGACHNVTIWPRTGTLPPKDLFWPGVSEALQRALRRSGGSANSAVGAVCNRFAAVGKTNDIRIYLKDSE